MTTPEAAKRYLEEHQSCHPTEPNDFRIYNPNNLPVDQLPEIIGFNNGGRTDWLIAIAIAEEGVVFAQHCCSAEGYMPYDLGFINSSNWKVENYINHYPNGFRCRFVSYYDVSKDEKLQEAFKKAEALYEQTNPQVSTAEPL